MPIHKGIKLRFAISILVILTLFSTILVNLVASAKALRSTLTDIYLENNYRYANKISLSTSDLIIDMQEDINDLGKVLGHQKISQRLLNNWRNSNSIHFNSMFIADSNGVIQIISPSVVQFNKKVQAGTRLQSETIKKALTIKKPFISEPYIDASGQLIVLISSPIFDGTGKYQGLIAGTIYLESDGNLINHTLYGDANGSNVYVVDRSGHIIFHPDSNRINEDVSKNAVVQKVMQRKSGAAKVVNSDGKEYFTGYTYEENTGWGIISETPTSVLDKPIRDLFNKIILQSLPLLLLILFVAGVLTNNLSKPLNKLAKFSEDAIRHKGTSVPFTSLNIKSNIYEVRQLYYHVKNYFQLLNNQIQLDGLTGLANRRTFDLVIKDWVDQKIPFTMIMVDIDRFKKVNDTYGHLAGDDVLKYLSSMIDNISGEDILCFRYGGEEFGILLKGENVESAFKVAEQLRVKVAETPSPTGEPITISLGISTSQDQDQHPEVIIKRADSALFKSKTDGRNRTSIYNESCDSTLA